MSKRIPTLIVGGGIGGLATALAISQGGRSAHVLESAPEFAEIGAGIQLAPNATRCLRTLGIMDRLRATVVFPRELTYMDALTGDRIASLDLGEEFCERYGAPYVVAHRSDLHRALLDACVEDPQVTLETGQHVVDVEDHESGVEVKTAGGRSFSAEALIGADGLHSFVRTLIHEDELVPSEYVAYRGTIEFSSMSSHAGRDNMVMWVGPELHLVQYKLRGGSLYNQVGVFRSHTHGESDDWGGPAELDEKFAECAQPVRYGASLLRRDMRWPMFDRDPIDNWTRNRITLMGDAAHPMLQYLAQGGCQAIEDAISLGRHISECADISEAFQKYQAEAVPRTARVQRTARLFGEVSHIGGVGRMLRNALFGDLSPKDFTHFDWLYARRPDAPPGPSASSQPVEPERLGASNE